MDGSTCNVWNDLLHCIVLTGEDSVQHMVLEMQEDTDHKLI
jgi:hypothetical protein